MTYPVYVFYLVHHEQPHEHLLRFLRAYDSTKSRKKESDVASSLVLIARGDVELPTAQEEGRTVVRVPEGMFDLGSYRAAAFETPEKSSDDVLIFLNSYARPLVPGWESMLARHASLPSVGVAGATGSYESPAMYGLGGHGAFPPFPNPHVRSNAFALRREVWDRVDLGQIRAKIDTNQLECGRTSITQQIRDFGLEAVVVGRNGEAYSVDRWREARTFRSGAQDNLLVADNHTDKFAHAGPNDQHFQTFYAWGEPRWLVDLPNVRLSATAHPRDTLAPTLKGDVLELGPGYRSFGVAPDARVKYADRRVGGRDATWPELVGHPSGPDADYDVDLDVDGLAPVATESFDVVISSHVLEHVANPLRVLQESWRVLRPGGRCVVILPDRHHTFDANRAPTRYAHLKEEFDRGVKEVSEEHVHDQCAAVFARPPIHPPHVAVWHDPNNLTPELYALHRKRSIHVHVWDAQEFAVCLVGAIRDGLFAWGLEDVFFVDDVPNDHPSRNEFGLVLVKPTAEERTAAHDVFVQDWVRIVQEVHSRYADPARIDAFLGALLRQGLS